MPSGSRGGSQLACGMRWGQPLMMMLPREEPRVMALPRCSQHLAAHGGPQELAMMCLEVEAVQNSPNQVQGQSKITATNIQRIQ